MERVVSDDLVCDCATGVDTAGVTEKPEQNMFEGTASAAAARIAIVDFILLLLCIFF
jgi:hypothetical protein